MMILPNLKGNVEQKMCGTKRRYLNEEIAKICLKKITDKIIKELIKKNLKIKLSKNHKKNLMNR